MEKSDWRKVIRATQRRLGQLGEPEMTRPQCSWAREQLWEPGAFTDHDGKPAPQGLISDMAALTVERVQKMREIFGVSPEPAAQPKPLPPPPPGEEPLIRVDGPSWWPLSVVEMFMSFRWLQIEALRYLGLCDKNGVVRFLASGEVEPFVDGLLRQQEQTGDSLLLRVPWAGPVGADVDDWDWVPFGGRPRESKSGLAEPPDWVEPEWGEPEPGEWDPWDMAEISMAERRVFRGCLYDPWERREQRCRRQQPLAQLADDADMLARKTCCRPEEAVAFLLCDRIPFTVPWVLADWEDDGGLVIRVGISEVMPKDVSDAYRDIKQTYLGASAGERRRRRANVYELLKFVGMRFPDGKVTGWPALWAEFDELHPGVYTLATAQTTFSPYRRALKYLVPAWRQFGEGGSVGARRG